MNSSQPGDYQEIPDPTLGDPDNYGVASHEMGSFMPVGYYQPKPIVWLAGAAMLQGVVMTALFLLLSSKAALFTVATTALVSIAIVRWTFQRGMGEASAGWRYGTVIFLTFSWAMVALGTADRW